MLFKVWDILRNKTYTVYAVSRDDREISHAKFLIYDENEGWRWIDSAFCIPVEE